MQLCAMLVGIEHLTFNIYVMHVLQKFCLFFFLFCRISTKIAHDKLLIKNSNQICVCVKKVWGEKNFSVEYQLMAHDYETSKRTMKTMREKAVKNGIFSGGFFTIFAYLFSTNENFKEI